MRKLYVLIIALCSGLVSVNAQTTQTFSYTGSNQTFVVPAGVTSISVKAWGAGGGGSATGGSGGSGALVKGTFSVTAGQSLVIVVGGGGAYNTSTSPATFGGGGASGGPRGGSGGGYSGIFLTSVSQANAFFVAGGGAGGGYYDVVTYGGAGGATTGSNGGDRTVTTFQGGRGATVAAGGAGGAGTNAGVAGTALTGGTGGTNATYGGGGGGGGYFGGGGGYGSGSATNYCAGGGGGSSFLGTMTATTNTAGTTLATGLATQAPGSAETGYVAGVGNGGSNTTGSTSGGNGLVVITYTLPACTTPTSLATPGSVSSTTLTTIAFNAFTAAAVPPTGYVVVRSTVNTLPTLASNTSYVVGANGTVATNGYIEYVGTTPGSWTSTGLTAGTPYYYFIFSYNNTACNGPVYSATAATANGTTASCPAFNAIISINGATAVPGVSYPTLTAAITDLKACGITQATTLELTSAYVPASETFPLTLPLIGGVTSARTITIRPASGVTKTITSANTTATVDINGGNYWIIDGQAGGTGGVAALTIANTSTATGGTAIRFINDASNNTIRYNNITSAYNAATSGVIIFSTTNVSGGNGNDNNKIEFNNIDAGAGATASPTTGVAVNGIYSAGSTTTTATNNSGNNISNNNIFNFAQASGTVTGIILSSGTTAWTISGNSFYQTATRTSTAALSMIPIYILTGDAYSITGNFIGGQSSGGGTTGVNLTLNGTNNNAFYGIFLNGVATTNAIEIQGNTIRNIDFLTSYTSATYAFVGILGAGINNIGNVTPNIIGSLTVPTSIKITQSTSNGSPNAGIIYAGTSAVNISNNKVAGIYLTTASANTLGASFYGIRTTTSTAASIISGNEIGNPAAPINSDGSKNSTTNANFLYGISSETSGINTITNNTVSSITYTASGGTGPTTAMLVSGIRNTAGTPTITGNNINNLSNISANTSLTSGAVALTGIYSSLGTSPVINGNTIFNLALTATGTGGYNVAGISYTAPTTSVTISRNRIYGITNASTSTTVATPGTASGILIRDGSGVATNINNNMIALGNGATTNTAFIGIWAQYNSSTSTTLKLYHNTVNIEGTAATGAIPSFGFERGDLSTTASTVFTVDIKNNIFVNTRTGGTGKHYAIANNYNATASNTGWPATASNNNAFNGTAANIGYWTTDRTFATWQTAGLGNDLNSSSGNPITFTNSANDLHINMGATATAIESGGVTGLTGSGATDDYDAVNIRTGYPLGGQVNGGGTGPDIGADEFDGAPKDILAPVITYTTLTSTCSTADITLSGVVITDATGVPLSGTLVPRIYYRKGAGAWFSRPGTTASVDPKNSTWSFTIVNADMGGVAGGDVISYYVIAQDITVPANIGSSPAAGLVATDVNTVTTPPTTPNTYTINSTLTGSYTVGAGGNFTTLPLAIAAYNSSCLGGNVTFVLTDASYTLASALTINANPFADATHRLTIVPNAGATRTISGTSSTGLIIFNGADFVTIDGSNAAGTDKSLTISNTSTGSGSSAILLTSLGTGAGATNNVIKNTILSTGTSSSNSYGISIGGAAGVPGADNDNNTIQNNTINTAAIGIYAVGTAAGVNDNLSITGNTITTNNTTSGSFGIQVGYGTGSAITQNTLSVNTSSGTVVGISVEPGFVSSVVNKNVINAVYTSATGGYGGRGITVSTLAAASGLVISNNMISGVGGASNYSAFSNSSSMGIALGVTGNTSTVNAPANGVSVYYNSVNMSGNFPGYSSAATITAGLYVGSASTALDIRNNIFVNSMVNQNATYAATSKSYAIYSDATSAAFTTINYNDYSVSGTQGVLGYLGSDRTNLAGIVTGFGGNANSVNVVPNFINAATGNLHLSGVGNNALNNAGTPVSVTVDIDNEARSGSTPDIGADEFVPCTPTPLAGIAANPVSATICAGQSITLTENGGTATSWTWSNGPTTQAITVSPTTTTTYTVIATVSAGCFATASQTVTVNPVPSALTITPTPAGDICEGDIQKLEATGGTITGAVLLNQNFNSGLGSWTVVNGGSHTAGTEWLIKTPPYTYDTDITSWNGFDGTNFIVANSDLSGSTSLLTQTRLTSPTFSTVNFTAATLTFKHYFRSSNETFVGVEYSLNGTSWTAITGATYTNTSSTGGANNPPTVTSVSLPLDAAALNQPTVQIRFRYDASFDWYWGLDDISLTGTQTTSVTWSPVTGLYLDAGATTTPYVANTPATIVYAKPSLSTTYTAKATSAASCSTEVSRLVTVKSIKAVISGSAVGCSGSAHNLTIDFTGSTATGPYSVTYTDGVTPVTLTGIAGPTTTVSVSPTANTTYTLTAASANGCNALPANLTGSAVISINAAPTAVINTTPTADVHTVCATTPLTLTAAGSTAGSGTISGYQWKLGGVDIGGATASTYSATLPGDYTVLVTNSNTCSTLSAIYTLTAATFTVTTTPTGAGTISTVTPSPFTCGTNVTFNVTPDACQRISALVVDGSPVAFPPTGATTVVFNSISANHTIAATFVNIQYTITASAGANGTISPATGSVNCGTNPQYTFTPDACYTVDDVLVDGISVGAPSTYTFTNVGANHTISVSFKKIQYAITSSVGSGVGTISPLGSTNVDCGDNQSYIFTPGTNYSVGSIIVDGVPLPAAPGYTFTNVQGTHTIVVNFILTGCANPATAVTPGSASTCANAAYTLSGSISGSASSGTWSTSGDGTFNGGAVYGTATTYTPGPNDITNGTVTITLTTDDPDGAGPCTPGTSTTVLTVNPLPVASIGGLASQSYCAGGSLTLTSTSTTPGVTTITNYQWNLGGSPIGGANSSTYSVTAAGTYTLTITNSNGCIVTSPAVTVTVNALPVAVIDGAATQSVCAGSTLTLTTTGSSAGSGTIFSYQWSNGGVPIGGATSSTLGVTAAGTYTVTITNTNNCFSTSATVTVTVNPITVVGTHPTGATYCENGTATALSVGATGTGTLAYQWYSNTVNNNTTGTLIGGATASTYTPPTTTAGTVYYYVVVSGDCGTAPSNTATVIVNPSPVATATASCPTVFVGGTTTITASTVTPGTPTYQWFSNTTNSNVGGTPIGGATAATYNPPTGAAGTFYYYAQITITGCPGLTPAVTIVVSNAALNGVYTIGGPAGCTNFPTIVSAVNYLNANGISGPVTFNVAAGLVENPTAVISVTATGTASNPIVFQKSGAGANPRINAYTGGTGTPATAVQDGIFRLVGSDYITIDGIDLNDANTTNPSTMEYGYGLFKASATDGANNNTIQNCVITLNRVNNVTGSNPAADGSVGIELVNALPSTHTTAVTPTTVAGTSSNNKFYANTIQNVNTGIHLFGYNDNTAPFTYSDKGNDVGGNSAATGNTILNFGGGGTSPSEGIKSQQQNTVNISYNTINSNNGSGLNHAGLIRGVWIAGSLLNSGTVTNNSITLKCSAVLTAAGYLAGIENNAPSSATLNINNNTITNSSLTAGTTAVFYGIYNVGAAANVLTINNNTISASSMPANTSGAFYGIYNNSNVTTLSINNNNLSGLTLNTGAAGSSAVNFIYNSGTATSLNINSNTIQNTLGLNTSGTIYLIYNSNGTSTFSVSGNTFTNVTRLGTLNGSLYGHYNFGSPGTGTATFNGNTFTNVSSGGGSSTFFGLHSNSAAAQALVMTNNTFTTINSGSGTSYALYPLLATSQTISGNTISGMTGTGLINVIYSTGGATANNIFQNTISGISTSGGQILGIFTGGTNANIYRNKIYDLTTTNAAGSIYGMFTNAGTNINIYNNIIGDLKAPAATITAPNPVLVGLALTAGTTINASYNTIYLSGTSTGTNFGSAAIFMNATPTTTTLTNNIAVNATTPTGTGKAIALQKSSTSLTNFGSASNSNLYYAGTPGVNNLIFYDGTNSDQTLATYKTRVAPRDANAITENPPFLSTTGSNANYLHISTAIATQIESGGIPVAGITTDFDGDTRNVSNPDIGADEFAGIPIDLIAPVITYTALGNACAPATDQVLTATITDASGVPTSGAGLPRLYYRVNAGPYTPVTGVSIGSNQYTFTFGAATTASGDVVSYYIVAQDNVSPTPNVSAFPSAGASGFTFSPPAAATPPTTPSTFAVTGSLNGTYTVGVGQAYTTLTAAVADYNAKCLSGPVVFSLTDATYPTETYPITINNNTYANSTNTLTIRPATGNTATFTSAVAAAMIKLNGANFITIDGSNSGGTDKNLNLTITSNSTSAAGVWIASTATKGTNTATVKNTVITGNSGSTTVAGVIISGSTIGAAAEISNNNVTITNNTFAKVQNGIYGQGNATTPDQNWTITNNTINSTVTADKGFRGAAVVNVNGFTISGNTFIGMLSTGTSTASGILVSGLTSNGNVFNNNIRDVKNTSVTGYGSNGIGLTSSSTTANIQVHNNMIVDVASNGYSLGQGYGDNGYGIVINSGAGYRVYYNTINLVTNQATGTSAAINITSGVTVAGAIDLRNNIIANSQTGGATRYAIYSGAANTVFSNINYNDYYNLGTALGYIGSVRTTLTDIQTGFGGNLNSISVDPQFLSATDAHVSNSSPVNGLATPIAGITTDIDGDTRNATTPDIGADEVIPTNNDAGITAFPGTYCPGSPVNVTVTVKNYGLINLNSATINWSVNGVPQTPFAWTAGTPLAPGATVNVVVGTYTFNGATVYTLTAATSLPNGVADEGPSNNSFTVTNVRTALSGTYTVGTAGDFTSLTAAVAAANTQGLCGPTTFSLTRGTYTAALGETYPITINELTGASATNTLTIKPATGVTPAITGSASVILKLAGADYITIDGSNTVNGTTRNLTISTTSTSDGTAAIFIGSLGANSGATFNTIKNTNLATGYLGDDVTYTYGIVMASSSSVFAAGLNNNNITIQNNYISKVYYGIWAFASVSNPNNNLSIIGNKIGPDVADGVNDIGFDGVIMRYATNVNVSNNIFQNHDIIEDEGGAINFIADIAGLTCDSNVVKNIVASNLSYGISSVTGLFVGNGITNVNIRKNTFTGIRNTTSSGFGARGVILYTNSNTAGNINFSNNFISDVYSYSDADDDYWPIGLDIDGATGGLNVHHNTINLSGSRPGLTGVNGSAALFVNSTGTNINVRNNLIINTYNNSNSTTEIQYGLYSTASAATQFSGIDYNDYYTTPTTGVLGYLSTPRTTLAAVQAAFGGNVNSVSIQPTFVSTADAHIDPSAPGNVALDNLGTPIAGITTDIDNDLRNELTPDMGADEFDPCSGTMYTWTGKISTDWATGGNWCSGNAPTLAISAYIPAGVPSHRYPILSGAGAANNVTIGSSVSDVVVAPTGILSVAGNFINNGKFTNNGTVRLVGNTLQTFPGPGQIGSAGDMNNLEIASTGIGAANGVKLTKSFGITNELKPTSGNLELDAFDITIRSTFAATAHVSEVKPAASFSYNGIGRFSVERFINTGNTAGTHKRTWQFLSVPTTTAPASIAQTIKGAWQEGATSPGDNPVPGYGTRLSSNRFVAAGAPNGFDEGLATAGPGIKTYRGDVDDWDQGPLNTNEPIANIKGWMVFVRGDRTVSGATVPTAPTTLRTRGALFTGTQTGITINPEKYGSIGNPYASAIDLTKVDTLNVTNEVYVWDPTLGDGYYGFGRFRTLTKVGNHYEAVPYGGAYPAGITDTIQSGQAIFYKARPGAVATVGFQETAKSSGSRLVNRGSSAAGQLLTVTLSSLLYPDAPVLLDGAAAIFGNFSGEVDSDDGRKIANSNENTGFRRNGTLLAVERRPEPVNNDTLHLDFTAAKQQSYSWKIAPRNIDEPGRAAWLVDRFLNTTTSISLTDTSSYDFVVNNTAGSYAADRFKIVFKVNVVLPVTITSISAVRNPDRSIKVKWSVENELNIDKYEVERSADGIRFSGIITTAATNSRNYSKDDLSPLAQDNYYRIKATSNNGQVQYSAIVKVAPLKSNGLISVYPNPVEGKTINLRFTDMTEGAYQLQLTNKLGQVVYSGTASVTAANFVKNITLSKVVTAGTYQMKVIDADGKAVNIQVVVQ